MEYNRPHTTVILAMSADGKIADFTRKAARFGSKADQSHLQKQIAAADAVLFGAGTLRAYGTTLTIVDKQLLQHRKKAGKQEQPIHIVITRFADINPEIRFFSQKISRWLLTTTVGVLAWEKQILCCYQEDYLREFSAFEQIMVFQTPKGEIDLRLALESLTTLGIKYLAVLGGGELVASMLELDLIDEFWLTLCPLIIGGTTAPTPVEGKGLLPEASRLQLLEVHRVGQEVFLHYKINK